MYVQVNIGRNVKGEPMQDTQWQAFQGDVRSAINDLIWDLARDYKDIEIETHRGTGYYNRVEEQSVHVSFFIPVFGIITTGPQTAAAMTSFTRHLRVLAREYGQDSIALITGSRLLKPTEEPTYIDNGI